MDETLPADSEIVDALHAVIRRRRTEKVLGEVDTPAADADPAADDCCRQAVLAALETAGWAPFHYPRNLPDADGGATLAEPWRAHVLWRDDARRLARYLRDDLQAKTKEPHLAAGCDALVLVTWLPQFRDGVTAEGPAGLAPDLSAAKQQSRDDEHLAATAAMTQNLLLLLTAHGMGTYWSSGGKLREPATLGRLGVTPGERLLAALFVEYPHTRDGSDAMQRVPGKLRDSRSTAWFREASLDAAP